MRLNQFLEKLAMTPRTWFVHRDTGELRSIDRKTRKEHCPITQVAQEQGKSTIYGTWDAVLLGPEIGLSSKTTDRIIAATDDDPEYATLRRRLLRKCGLTQPKQVRERCDARVVVLPDEP
jgi:hypothetical protein